MRKFKLQYRLMMYFVFLIFFLSISMSWGLLNRAGAVIRDEFIERAHSITKNLAKKAELGVLIENNKLLHDLIADLLREKDVLYVKIYNRENKLLSSDGRFENLDINKLFIVIYAVVVNVKDTIKEDYEKEDFVESANIESEKYQGNNNNYEKIGIAEVGFSTKAVNNAILKIKYIMVIITSFFIIIGIGIAYLFSKTITRPIKELVTATQKIAQGELTYEIHMKNKDEIGILADSFNIMTKDLKRNMDQLENLTNQLEIKVKERTKELEQANIKLQDSNVKIKEADKMKSEFLARMSHELRTPLNAILGFSGIILSGSEGQLNKDILEDIRMIEGSGRHLLGLINNILDLSKIEAGKMELSIEEFNIIDVVKEILSTANVLMGEKDINLIEDIDKELPTINADKTRIKQVIFNLIGNAIKFTDKGTITIRIRLHRDNEMLISVSDTGIGIKEEDLEKVFSEFSLVELPYKHKGKGTGLGLAISKKFIEMHKGRIWVESKVGVGSSFYFTLPVKKKTSDKLSIETKEKNIKIPLHGTKKKIKKIGILDDDPNIIALFSKYLEKEGYEVFDISASLNSVEKIIEYKPDLIILDILMPEKNGWGIIRELKEYPETINIPIIICSIIDEKARGFALGAKAYLLKPIEKDELTKAIDKIRQELTKILIIDDNTADIILLRKMLEDKGYKISSANNGIEGLKCIREEPPDLIILDLMMPELDGFTILEDIKQDQKLNNIPIIVVSAKDITYEDIVRFEDNVKTLLKKGTFTKEELVKNVLHILNSEYVKQYQ